MSGPETVGRERGEPLGTNYLNLLFFVMFTTVQRFPLNVVFDSPGLYFALISSTFCVLVCFAHFSFKFSEGCQNILEICSEVTVDTSAQMLVFSHYYGCSSFEF